MDSAADVVKRPSSARRTRTPLRAWISGARPRTLTLGAAPVVLGTAAAHLVGPVSVVRALLCLAVAVLLQIAVNFSNDYSDGVRGTDRFRVGPPRLTGAGTARPRAVLAVAVVFAGLAAAAGVLLVVSVQIWWLLPVGAAAIVSAWFYTGGKHPYGYHGLGEPFVFVFFGLVAVGGTELVLAGQITAFGAVAAVAAGSFACAVLIVNNLRDVDGDQLAGKSTLAVVIGRRAARVTFAVFLILPYVALAVLVLYDPLLIVAVLSLGLTIPALVIGVRGRTARRLVTALKLASSASLLFAVLIAGTVAIF